ARPPFGRGRRGAARRGPRSLGAVAGAPRGPVRGDDRRCARAARPRARARLALVGRAVPPGLAVVPRELRCRAGVRAARDGGRGSRARGRPRRGRGRAGADPPRGRRAAQIAPLIDASLLARVRAEVAAGVDPAGLLSLYAEPTRRTILRERVRVASRRPLADEEVDELCAELFGFGPLQRYLDDPAVTDVPVNGPRDVFVERAGRLERAPVEFRGPDAIGELAHRIAASVGRELTLERPFVDARMRDGSRANAVIAPVGGPTLSIRKFERIAVPLEGAS